MLKITAEKVLNQINGSGFVGMSTRTQVKLTGGKKNPQQGRIEKLHEGATVMCFTNKNQNGYENMVKRRLTKEGINPDVFKLGKRVWGERVPNTPFVEHKGGTYIEVIFIKSGKVSYLQDGQPIKKADIEGLPVESEGGQGGLKDKVQIRTFALKSILSFRYGGQEYV